MPTPESSAPNTTLVNAELVEVEYLDGRKEPVRLRRLSIRDIYTLAELVRGARTPQIVALCADKPIEWVDTLTDAAFSALTEKCVSSNFQRAQAIAEKDPAMAMLVGPVVASGIMSMAEMLKPTAAALLGTSIPSSSAAPLSSESAAASGSASST